MPKFTGIRCEECTAHVVDEPLSATNEPFREILVGVREDTVSPLILLGGSLSAMYDEAKTETHYLCSTKCLFAHITKLLKLDPVAQYRAGG
jgi:hypothetical protein